MRRAQEAVRFALQASREEVRGPVSLVHGYSRRSIAKNIATEQRAGKPRAQAVAIAFSEARRAAKKSGHGDIVKQLSRPGVKKSEPTIHCEACGRERPAKGAAKYTKGLGSWHVCASCIPKKKGT